MDHLEVSPSSQAARDGIGGENLADRNPRIDLRWEPNRITGIRSIGTAHRIPQDLDHPFALRITDLLIDQRRDAERHRPVNDGLNRQVQWHAFSLLPRLRRDDAAPTIEARRRSISAPGITSDHARERGYGGTGGGLRHLP